MTFLLLNHPFASMTFIKRLKNHWPDGYAAARLKKILDFIVALL